MLALAPVDAAVPAHAPLGRDPGPCHVHDADAWDLRHERGVDHDLFGDCQLGRDANVRRKVCFCGGAIPEQLRHVPKGLFDHVPSDFGRELEPGYVRQPLNPSSLYSQFFLDLYRRFACEIVLIALPSVAAGPAICHRPLGVSTRNNG